jgi:hypothetical protein
MLTALDLIRFFDFETTEQETGEPTTHSLLQKMPRNEWLEEYLDFVEKVETKVKKVNTQKVYDAIVQFKKDHGDILKNDNAEAIAKAMEIKELAPLALITKYYLGNDFHATLDTFAAFCLENLYVYPVNGSPVKLSYLDALTEYLERRDPLRALVTEDALFDFLKPHRPD